MTLIITLRVLMALTLVAFMVFVTLYGVKQEQEYFNWSLLFAIIYFILNTNV